MRKRSKYRPRPQMADPLTYVLESVKPVTAHDNYLLDLKLVTTAAFADLSNGTATREHINKLVAAHNIAQSLMQLGFGSQFEAWTDRSKQALVDLCARYQKLGRYVATGPELQALRDLLELHDMQMECITVGDMDRAIKHARKLVENNKATKLYAGAPSDNTQ